MRHGLLLIDKPVGPTSHDIVAMTRKALNIRKVGHLGTLDPLASGLMVLAVGEKGLKVVEFFSDLDKEYEAEVTFGSVSTTYDREGVMEVFPRKPGVGDPTIEELTRTIQDRFVGKISQVPPAYSAIKEGGERAYRKMRQGRGVDLPAREVEIAKCDVVAYDYPVATLRVSCGSGTYIRSLAHDLGAELRVGGHLSALRRVSAGMPARTTDGSSITWNVQDAVQIEDVKWADVIPLKEILAGFPRIDLSDSDASNVRHGRDIDGDVEQNTIGWHEELPIAILEPVTGGVHARKVL